MKRFVVFLIILIIAIYFGLHIQSKPGFILIAYGRWTIEMPIWFAILSLIILYGVLYSLVRFLKCSFALPQRWRLWLQRRRRRHAQDRTNRGLIELAEGHWARAEKQLVRSVGDNNTPLINYLAAARAAQEQGAYERRDKYLRRAHTVNPDAQIAIELTQAQLQLNHKQLEQALATLRHLREIVPHHRYVLKLLQTLYLELNDWHGLIELLPELRKYRILTPTAANDLEQTAYLHFFQTNLLQTNILQAGTPKAKHTIAEIWSRLPKRLRYDSAMVKLYTEYLITQGEKPVAETLLCDTLKKTWNDELLLLYAKLADPQVKKQLSIAEAWLKRHKNDPILLYTLARVCIANQLWGKARSYLEASIAIKPMMLTYHALAALLENLGDKQAAVDCYRLAAQLYAKSA